MNTLYHRICLPFPPLHYMDNQTCFDFTYLFHLFQGLLGHSVCIRSVSCWLGLWALQNSKGHAIRSVATGRSPLSERRRVGCGFNYSAVSNQTRSYRVPNCREIDEWWIEMDSEGIAWLNRRAIPEFYVEILRKIMRYLVKTVGVPTEVGTEHLLDTRLDCYHCVNP
jgi:hypothetical protein